MNRMWILAGLVLAVSICASAQCESTMKELLDSWVKNWNNKQLDKVIELYAPDATYLSSDGQRVVGRDDIRAYFKTLIYSDYRTKKIESVKIGCSGEMGYDSGRFLNDVVGGVGVPESGEYRKTRGNYLVVIRKTSGKWLLVQHASIASPQ